MGVGANAQVKKEELTVFSLNEHDPKLCGNVDWRSKLDNQRGAVLANELKNNAAKLGRWTTQSLLSGADMMKIGFTSRLSFGDPTKHLILGTASYRPKDFLTQINLSERNAWGVVKAIIEMMMKRDQGKYLLVRDVLKPILRLYKIPMDSFENPNEEINIEEILNSAIDPAEKKAILKKKELIQEAIDLNEQDEDEEPGSSPPFTTTAEV